MTKATTFSFCYSSQVCLSGFWLRNTSLVKVGNPISHGIVFRLRVVPHFSPGIVERAKRERAGKSPHERKGDTRRVSPFLAWVIFTRDRVSLALLSRRKNGGLLVVYIVFVFHLAWCVRGLKSLKRFWPYLIVFSASRMVSLSNYCIWRLFFISYLMKSSVVYGAI